VSDVVYLDTSAVLRAVLETGVTPELEQAIAEARFLITSRLSLVESARALLRLRAAGATSESTIADAGRATESLWARCTLWELTPAVCELAAIVAPQHALRTLDALHAATFVLARRKLGTDVVLLTADDRLAAAVHATAA
jgi:predicted nucleic acid-binding protein